jgi:hypothetical protein
LGEFVSAPTPTIAISATEVKLWGCPHCGFQHFSTPMSGMGTTSCECGECGKAFLVLASGMTKSSMGLGHTDASGKEIVHYPELSEHPRRGTPSHGRPDTRPGGSGEFFGCRGIGKDWTPGCFVCGGSEDLYNNISGFVRHKDAGTRVVAMFQHGAKLDYREREPDWIQVKIGSCEEHLANLRMLADMVSGTKPNVITPVMVQAAIVHKP